MAQPGSAPRPASGCSARRHAQGRAAPARGPQRPPGAAAPGRVRPCSTAELADVGPGSPLAEPLRAELELALAIQQFVCAFAHARGILEHHAVRSFEVQDARSEEHTSELQSLLRISY